MHIVEDLTEINWRLPNERRGLFKRVFFLALPIILLQILFVTASFIDTAFLSRLGDLTLAANGLGYRAYYVVLIFVTGVVLALGVRLARVSDEPIALRSMLIQCFYLIFVLAVVCFFLLDKLAPYLFQLAGQPSNAVAASKPYLHQLAIAVIAVLYASFLRQILMVIGRQVWLYPIAALYLISHVIFSYGLIFGNLGMPRLGLLGAGVSEWLSLSLTIIFSFVLLMPLYNILQLSHSKWRTISFKPSKRLLAFLCSFSWPVAGLLTLEMLAITFFVIMIGHFGIHAIASYQMISQLDLLPLMIPYGMGIAIGILSSNHLSRSINNSQIRIMIRYSLLIVALPTVIFSLLFWLCPHYLLSLFFHNNSFAKPGVASLAVHMLMITGLYNLFYCLRNILTGALRGLDDVYMPMILTVCCFWVLGLGSAYLLSQTSLGPLGVWCGMAVAMITASLAIFCRYIWILKTKRMIGAA